MTIDISYKDTWLNKVMDGVSKAVGAAASTLGPKGRLVICGNRITKDGKTVMDLMRQHKGFKDPMEQIGLDFAARVASEVASEAGDSTTTALVLFEAILKSGARYILAKQDAVQITMGIEEATNHVLKFMYGARQEVSKDDSRLQALATTSCNKDHETGEQVAKIIAKVGQEGVVNIEDNTSLLQTEVTFAEGAQINAGYKSSYFATNQEKGLCEMENPMILFTDKALNSYEDATVFMENIIPKLGSKPLFIICDKCEGFFMKWLSGANVQQVFRVCAIEIPGYGDAKNDAIGDIAAITGATLISSINGTDFKDFNPQWFGTAKKIVCDSKMTSIIVSDQNISKTKARSAEIQRIIDLEHAKMQEYKLQALKKRSTNLTGLVCTYRVGGANELARKERRDRIEDAILATQSALEGGLLPGGCSLIKAQRMLEEVIKAQTGRSEAFLMGMRALHQALSAPAKQNLINADVERPDVVIQAVYSAENPNTGYDIESGKLCDMIAEGIIDSQKSQSAAVKSASTNARLILSSSVLLIKNPEEEDPIRSRL